MLSQTECRPAEHDPNLLVPPAGRSWRPRFEEECRPPEGTKSSEPVGFVTLDRNGVIREMDVRMAAFLKVDGNDVVGVPFCVFVQQGHLETFYRHLVRNRNRVDAVSELVVRPRKGKGVRVQLWSTPRHLGTTEVVLQIALIRLSSGHPARAARVPAARSLPSPGRNLRTHVAVAALAHELRNALMPLTMCLPMLKETSAQPQSRNQLQAMCERQVSRMTRLIDDALDLSRAGLGKIRMQSRRFELNELVRTVVELKAPEFEQREITFYKVEPPFSLYVDGDVARLEQVLTNLLHNAAKFTDRGGCVSVHLRREGAHAVLEVQDSGRGIAAESLACVFQPFVQAESTDERNTGLGLGLALVKALVELHGGTVDAASAGIGKGAEFTVRLPLARERQAEVSACA
jgi:signal transduction histidine kinase